MHSALTSQAEIASGKLLESKEALQKEPKKKPAENWRAYLGWGLTVRPRADENQGLK